MNKEYYISVYLKGCEDTKYKYKNQQKEFIEYLENEIENQKSEIFENSLTSEDIDLYIMRVKLLKYEEILSKYKEIIGGKE